MLDSFPKLDELVDEIERLKTSHKLLEEIYYWYGPYGPASRISINKKWSRTTVDAVQKSCQKMEMPEELHRRMRDHFGFDDSE